MMNVDEALAFAKIESFEGDTRVLATRAVGACRLLAKEIERLRAVLAGIGQTSHRAMALAVLTDWHSLAETIRAMQAAAETEAVPAKNPLASPGDSA